MGRDIQVVLPSEIPPALTGLPRPAAVFTGRDDEVQSILDELHPARAGGTMLVTAVAGMGGIGKTELVLNAADQALKTQGWFPGGVLFVNMFGYDPDRQLSAGDALLGWLQAAGIPGENIPTGEQDRSRLWRSVLSAYTSQDRRLLLIIDNAGSEDQVTPLLPSDPQIAVLVTSRHTLDIDARLHSINTLDDTAAVTLVSEVITQRRGADDPRLHDPGRQSGLNNLIEVCAGLPLALRIVAALLADRPQLYPAALAERLRNEQARLDGLSRQQVAVRTTFDLSYRHLTDAEAHLFRLLPINPGPDIATTGAATLADLSDNQTTILLEGLHRAHLIDEPSTNRWQMHDLVRLYAASQPPAYPDESAQARRRLFTYYKDTACAANTHLDPALVDETTRFIDREQALGWLDAERANLIGVCTTQAHHFPSTSADIAQSLARFLHLRRHLNEWIMVATSARDIQRQAGDRRGEARAWNNLGLALQQMRRFDEAITAQTRAREVFQELGDRHGVGRAWNNSGLALRYLRRFDEAIAAHTQARDIFHELGDRHFEGTAWNNLGASLQEVRRFEEAITAHSHAREIFHHLRDRHIEGTAWGNLGLALRKVRRFDEAIAAHTQAREIFQQLGDRFAEGAAWNGLGLTLAEVGRFEEAISAHTRDLEICQELGDRHGEGTASSNLGTALAEVGRFDEAITAHTRDLEICQELGDRHGEAGAWNSLGLTLVDTDRLNEAISVYTAAHAIFQEVGDQHGEGRALGNLGTALAKAHRFDEAGVRWNDALVAFTESCDSENAAMIREWLKDLQPTERQEESPFGRSS